MIFDTNSTAGIIVNNKQIEKKAYLNDGDSVILGSSEYIFFSTAVTTRQHVVPKNSNDSSNKPVKNQNSVRGTQQNSKRTNSRK